MWEHFLRPSNYAGYFFFRLSSWDLVKDFYQKAAYILGRNDDFCAYLLALSKFLTFYAEIFVKKEEDIKFYRTDIKG
jgi:hypothetical protein